MKKSEQIQLNKEVKLVQHDLQHCIDLYGAVKLTDLNYCKASVWSAYGYIFLKSYDTIVACIPDGVEPRLCYDFSRLVHGYTATTCQHIHKFCRAHHVDKLLCYKPVK